MVAKCSKPSPVNSRRQEHPMMATSQANRQLACVVVGSALIAALALKFRSFVYLFSVEYNALNENVV